MNRFKIGPKVPKVPEVPDKKCQKYLMERTIEDRSEPVLFCDPVSDGTGDRYMSLVTVLKLNKFKKLSGLEYKDPKNLQIFKNDFPIKI